MAEARTLLTGDDLLRMSASAEPCVRYELVKGELKQMPPVGGPHGDLTTRLAYHL